MPKVSVCLSTDLIGHHSGLKNKSVVIIDILRASTCMVTAFMEGAESIRAFSDLGECIKMKDSGYLVAGERNGSKVDGFDLGNSPYDYINAGVKGKKIAITTTNGTEALAASRDSDRIFIGSFLNTSALCHILVDEAQDALLFCAGWKGRPNTEDTLFAGMVLSNLIKANWTPEGDESSLALDFYLQNQEDIFQVIKNSAHASRLSALTDISEDLKFCSLVDKTILVPELSGDDIICK